MGGRKGGSRAVSLQDTGRAEQTKTGKYEQCDAEREESNNVSAARSGGANNSKLTRI